MENQQTPLDIQEIMREIRERVRTRCAGPTPDPTSGQPCPVVQLDVSRFGGAARRVRLTEALVGQAPPQPPGLRPQIGAVLVRLVQRMLFWYTPQILQFHGAVAQATDELVSLLEALSRQESQSLQGLEKLKQEVALLERRLAGQENRGEQMEAAVQGLRAELRSERQAREALGGKLESERQAREALGGKLESERQAREALGGELESERQAREALSGKLESERQAREALGGELESERQAREALGGKLESERQAREALGGELESERQAREWLAARLAAVAKPSKLKAEAIVQKPLDQQQIRVLAEDQHRLDDFYCSLIDEFRGTRQDIIERLRVYLPYLHLHLTRKRQILDLGCGRGEWLELLREEGFQAQGVDINRVVASRCRKLGLQVAEGDLISFLQNLPDSSMSAITAFHVIEHLPWSALIDLVDETVRVLRPGGLAIFETPNPHNVLVGCHNFYLDPTHHRPLPAPLVRFMVEARGLCDLEVIFLHPYPEAIKANGDGQNLVERFNEYFYGPQDFAVIGKKPL